MNQCIAILLSMLVMLSGLGARAESISPNKGAQSEALFTSQAETVEDGKMTLEVLQQVPSWEYLVNLALPIEGSWSKIQNPEDKYLVSVIKQIDEGNTTRVYHDAKYVAYQMGIIMEKIDYERLLEKLEAVISLYNTEASDDLKLLWETEVTNETCMWLDIKSTNLNVLEKPAWYIGQQVVLREGVNYWTSAYKDGSGKYGTVTDDNKQIPQDRIVTVTRCAYLDENRRNVTENVSKKGTQIRTWDYRLLLVSDGKKDLGWIYPEDCFRLED